MQIVNIIGGLGNQMFQYAFAFALSQKNNQPIKLDITDFKNCKLRDYQLELFNIKAILATEKEVIDLKYKKRNIFIRTFRKPKRWGFADSYYPEPHFHFDKKALSIKNDTYFQGYWQSEQYFKKYRNELLKQFTLKAKIHTKTEQYRQKITQTESISLHIRRGDYVTNEKTNANHGVCGLDYYKNAIAKIKQTINKPHFFIFSDDLAWARDNLNFIDNITFITLEATTPDHEEIALMSLCQHNIIANSSFSWWGAWLNQNPAKIVITPKKRSLANNNADNLYPKSWIVDNNGV